MCSVRMEENTAPEDLSLSAAVRSFPILPHLVGPSPGLAGAAPGVERALSFSVVLLLGAVFRLLQFASMPCQPVSQNVSPVCFPF